MLPYAALTFASALLLFVVQPLMARAILPWFGGAAGVWTTCLLFYQALLFAGYAYAHAGRRLGATRQAALHAVLMGGAVAILPIVPDPRWQSVDPGAPTLRLLGLLAASVGLPYLLLAGTTPLLHAWFGRRHPGRSPYRLYAVSNVGSLLALAAYPLLVEPLMRLRTQQIAWSGAYAVFALAMAALAWSLRGGAEAAPAQVRGGADGAAPRAVTGVAPARDADSPSGARPTPGDYLFWLALAACGTALLMSLTNTITMDVASAPLLWVAPLALYLVTFIVAFAGRYRRETWGVLLVLSLAPAALLWVGGFALPTLVQAGLALAVLFTACMVCHGELARSAPDPVHLTGFYLAMAGGGALGGALVGVVAPWVLTDFFEMPMSLLAAFALLVVAMRRDAESVLAGRGRRWALAALGAVWVGAALLFASPGLRNTRGTVAVARNFYGVLRVQDRPPGVFQGMRVMRHGRIFHGAESLDPVRRGQATAYFTEGSGVAQAVALSHQRHADRGIRIGVIGLGVGTLAAWIRPGDALRFYEINPAAERLARSGFTFLDRGAGAVDVVLGDGRLALARDVDGGGALYDVLVIDAFAGDAVPMHLLTAESMELYRRALSPAGLLVFQVTNRHVDLERVVRGLAGASGMSAVRVDHAADPERGGVASSWMVLGGSAVELPAEVRAQGTRPTGTPVLWTDDFSNIVSVLRAR